MTTVLGLDKKPSVYDVYKTTLGPEDLQKAKEQLHEDENTREPGLAQMREYIAKHPQIIRCRTDCLFLLRFLRARKFNMQATYEMFDNWLVVCNKAKDFFRLEPDILSPLVEQAIVVPMGADQNGRLVVIIRFGLFDPQTITPEEQIRLTTLALEIFLETELYQVNGLVLVLDLQGTTMAHFGVWTFPKLKTIMSATNDILPIRLKEVHVVQLPKYATMLMEFCVSALKPKLQKRLKFHKSLDDLKAAIDNSVLPSIYGGSLSLEEANDRFRKRIALERDRLLLMNEILIDRTIPNPNAKSSNNNNNNNAGLQSDIADEAIIGSFRKLNVD